MQKSKIEWTDYSINPVKGLCPMACPYCYARRMYKRFHWDEELHYNPDVFRPFINREDILPSRIFVGSTMELFGDWVEPIYLKDIFVLTQYGNAKQHTFIFLTKQPQNLIKYSPFPKNVWVGVSATNHNELANRWGIMRNVQATVKFVSFEPLLDWADEIHSPIYQEGIINSGIDWVIIGQQTPVSELTRPNPDWIREIITACNAGNIPIFIKNNIINDGLLDLRLTEMRQEVPFKKGIDKYLRV